ncbi:MAG: hypothetical protein AB7L65_08165, partial [Hyphomonadaceae bacterium]
MSAQSWSVKGIDPKVREAVREAAARQGLSLGEYLNQALQKEQERGARAPARPRPQRIVTSAEEIDDWLLTAPADLVGGHQDQRLEAVERRTQLAVKGLDRAVTTIDRSMLGLAARVDDAEMIARESADRVAEALEQFREAGEILSGRLGGAEAEAHQSRQALESAARELAEMREGVSGRLNSVDEIARKAEVEARALARELHERDASLAQRLAALEDQSKSLLGAGLAEARAAAEAAAREAAISASSALEQLRVLHETMERKLADTQHETRRLVQSAIAEAKDARAALIERLSRSETDARRIQEALIERIAGLENQSGGALAETAEEIRAVQAAMAARLDKIEQGGREATAGLRQAAGAAIADLRNAQLGIAARLKLMEENTATAGGAVDLESMRAAQSALSDRLARLERAVAQPSVPPELAARLDRIERAHDALEPEFSARLDRLEDRPALDPDLAARLARLEEVDQSAAAAALEARFEELSARVAGGVAEAAGASQTLEASLQRLAERIAETESTANNAIRTLEETVAGLGAKVSAADTQAETESLRALLEARINGLAEQITTTVQGVRSELVERIEAANAAPALDDTQLDGLESALADVNMRLASAERRQAQTIEAISVEIKRMSETVDRRLRAVETRESEAAEQSGASEAVREEVSRLAAALEARFEEIERREAAAFDRMGLEVGRLSERLEDRFATVETRSAQAIEQVGEQVARMAERFNQRQDGLARDLSERLLDSEERAKARVSDAISGLMHRLSEVEEHSVEAVTPVARAMSTMASRLQALEDSDDSDDEIPTLARRKEDAPPLFGELAPAPAAEADAAPLAPPPSEEESYFDLADDEDGEPLNEAAPVMPPPERMEPPVRAGPLPPLTPAPSEAGAEAEDLVLEDDTPETELTALAENDLPPVEESPFWSLQDEAEEKTAFAPEPEAAQTEEALFGEPTEAEPPPPTEPEKVDYLTAARRAAQSQAEPKKAFRQGRGAPAELRGPSRVVLWGAAGAIALLVAGGAYMLNRQSEHAAGDGPSAPPTPDAFEPAAPPPPVAPFDGAAGAGAEGAADAPADPAAADGAAAPGAAAAPAGEAEAAQTPVAAANPPRVGAAAQAVAVAQPLPPRTISLDAAAARGDQVAQYELALQRLAAGRTNEGVTLLRQSANQGLAMAQYRMAKLYERGEGVPADLAQARAWTERAAAAGNRRAMHDLGVYFARGEGAPLDEAAAFRWFRQAAELGVADSQFNLGVL